MKTYNPNEKPMFCVSHVDLEDEMKAMRVNQIIKNELRLVFSRCCYFGEANVNTDVLRYVAGRRNQEMISYVLNKTGLFESIPVNKYGSSFSPGKACKMFVFTGRGVSERDENDFDNDLRSAFNIPSLKVDKNVQVKLKIPAEFINNRRIAWKSYIIDNNYPVNYDDDGSTEWGRSILHGLETVVLPDLSVEQCAQLVRKKHADKVENRAVWWHKSLRRLKHNGLSKFTFRKQFRAYHGLSCCPGDIRLLAEFDWVRREMAVEVDLKASYFVFLAVLCTDRSERRKLTDMLSFGDIYKELAKEANVPEEPRKVLKERVMIDVLFHKDHHPESARPMFRAFARLFPVFAKRLREYRKKHTSRDLSDMLMKSEARLFIDGLCVSMSREGLPCVPVHDSVLVPESVCELVKEELEDISEQSLGFGPRFEIKRS